MENILYKNNRIVLFAKYNDPQLHKHFSKHILVSNKPFLCKINEEQWVINSAVIQSNTLHSVKRNQNAKMIVYLIDETSSLSKVIDETYLKNKAVANLPIHIERKMIHLVDEEYSLNTIDKYIIEELNNEQERYTAIDDRVLYAIKYIEKSESIDSNIYDFLSEKSYLSKSRFLHLFKKELGIDLRNYLLLKKLEKTYEYIIFGKMNITEAAVLAGFSSPSHFSSSCKKHYGISFTDFLNGQKNKI